MNLQQRKRELPDIRLKKQRHQIRQKLRVIQESLETPGLPRQNCNEPEERQAGLLEGRGVSLLGDRFALQLRAHEPNAPDNSHIPHEHLGNRVDLNCADFGDLGKQFREAHERQQNLVDARGRRRQHAFDGEEADGENWMSVGRNANEECRIEQ
jgi:hypothetical protein